MNNMDLYNAFREVPDKAIKPITAGRLKGMSDINPMWRIQRLTEKFGPCGVGWWYDITEKKLVTDDITKQIAAFVDIQLYYVDPETGTPSHGIPGTGGASFVAQERNGAYLSDECFKMALTDALSVAAKALGVGADVYFPNGRSKYSAGATPTPEPERKPKPKEELLYRCEQCHAPIGVYKDDNGKDISIRKWTEGSKLKFGKVLCDKCVEALKANENQ